MQSYDPNQSQQSSQGGGYYQQPPQNQQTRMTLPPASSFFGQQSSSSSGDYHQIPNTPLSEPPPSPYVTGQYNQPQSYPATDPNTPYMHSSAISPPNNYNIGPSPHYPPQAQMQQQIYNPLPSQNMDQQGYIGMEQQHHGHPQQPQHLQQQQQQLPPQHHQIQMGYPSTSIMQQPQQQQDHSMQMGYISPMDQGIIVNYPPQQQHQNYSNIQLPPQSHHQGMHQMPTPIMQQPQQQQILLPPPQQLLQQSQQQPQQHSHPGQTPHMSNNLRHQHVRQQQQQQILLPSSSMQRPLPSTMESIIPSSSDNNMSQVLQMQQQSSQPQKQQQHQPQQQSLLQKQEREAATAISNNIPRLPQQVISNYNISQQHSQQQQKIQMVQRSYDGSNITRYSQPQQHVYQSSETNNYQNIPMGPPTMPHRVYQEQQQQQISQDYHQQQIFESQQTIMPNNFPTMNEPSPMTPTFQSKNEQAPMNRTELSIVETVNEVIAKNSAAKIVSGNENAASSSPQPPQPKRRRNTRTTETVVETIATNEQQQTCDGPTVKQHFQAQQNEKRKQEQHDKYLTKIREDMEKHNIQFDPGNIDTTESFKVPGMTRTEFLQAHRQRKSESNQEIVPKQYEKDTVVEIIEEIAGSSFPETSPEPPPYEFSSQHQQSFDNDSIQIIEADNYQPIHPSTAIQSFDELPDTNNTVTTPTKPKPKRIRKKPPPRETKVQKENKRKFLFKCLHLQRTIRSLILKNSALADETSRLFYRIKTVTEERKILAKRVQHYERNRIRRIQSQKKKKAKAEAELAQQQQQNYPPSVEIYEPEINQESVEAFPFENMTHKEMAVYLPPVNEDFGQIPYLDPSQYPFEDFHEPMNPNSEYSNLVYSVPSQFDQYTGHQNIQSFPPEMQEVIPPPPKRQRLDAGPFESQQFFNIEENDNSHHSYFEQHQQQPISRSETPTFHEALHSTSSAS